MPVAEQTLMSSGNPPYDSLSLSLQIPSGYGNYQKIEITTKFGLGQYDPNLNFQVELKNLTDNVLIGEQAACGGWINDPEHTLPHLGYSKVVTQGMWGRIYGNPNENKQQNPYVDWDFWLCPTKHVMYQNNVNDYIQASITALETGKNKVYLAIYMKIETFYI